MPINTHSKMLILTMLGAKFVILMASLYVGTSVHAITPPWAEYDALLKDFVVSGTTDGVTLNQVDYSGLARDPRFERLVSDLADFPVGALQGREERLALYINAYNILTVKIVIENSPLKSIKDVGNFFRPVWKREAGIIGGTPVSLNEIEHDILRKMNDPRIHFAIVCASVSCPDLRMEAYRAKHLDQQLDEQVRDFLLNTNKGSRLDNARVEVSRIFKWFEEDFDRHGGVEGFIGRYIPLAENTPVRPTLDYNWSLNGR